MSANNELIIIKNTKGKFEIHENICIDNDFISTKNNLLEVCNTLQEAIKFCNQYMREEVVEYGYHICDNCLEDEYAVMIETPTKKYITTYKRGGSKRTRK